MLRNPNWLNSLSPLLSSSSSPSSSEGLVNLTWVAALAHAQDASDDIDWNQIFFVRRHPIIRYSQLFIAVYGLVESLFYFYLSYNVISSASKANRRHLNMPILIKNDYFLRTIFWRNSKILIFTSKLFVRCRGLLRYE